MIVVTDAHVLMWAATGKSKKLGIGARRIFQRAESGSGDVIIYVPTIALVEIGEAVDRGRFTFHLPFSEWVKTLFKRGPYRPADLTIECTLAARQLRGIPERGDRLIAATAVALECPLLTRDAEIREQAGGRLRVIWD